jgi:hypothetical protein
MLAGDCRAWRPSVAAELWTILRLATLHALWTSRGTPGTEAGVTITAAGVVCRIVHGVRGSIKREWQRVVADIRRESGTCAGLLRGRNPQMPRKEFEKRWCCSAAICRVTEEAEQAPQLQIGLAPGHPVLLPSD